MKSIHTTEFWASHYDEYLKKTEKSHKYTVLENKLNHELECLKSVLDESQLSAVIPTYAEKIASEYEAFLKNEMKTIQELKSGRASLGYTTKNQEVQAMHELVYMFEFNCYQLSVFRKKYQKGA